MGVKYFPTWERYLQTFRETEMTNSQLGWLWLAMMEYQFENKEPEKVPKGLKLAWTYIRKDLDDARRHYETSVQNGRKGGRPKKQKPENNPEETQENLEKVTSTTTTSSTTTTTATFLTELRSSSGQSTREAATNGAKSECGHTVQAARLTTL